MDAQQLLQGLIGIENAIARYEFRKKRINDRISVRVAELETLATGYKNELEKHLKQSATTNKHGEPELVIEGKTMDYVVGFSSPRGSIKVSDVDAVPDEFVKTERKAKLKEIAEYIETHQVNWAAKEFSAPTVVWKVRKKK